MVGSCDTASMRIDVSDEPAAAAADWMVRRLRTAVRTRGHAALAVSGGSTAPPMIDAIETAFASDRLAVGRVTVWQVDERVAPDGDAARNAVQLARLPCRVRLMPVTASDRRSAARRYAATLPDRFDVVHLGIGDDGHTASWPPDQPSVARSARSVELTGPFNGRERMTLTAQVINAARARAVLVTGAAKQPVIERWLARDHDLPITLVRRAGTVLFVDRAAAPTSPPR